MEKFRPYSFPWAEWLESITAQMRARPQGTPVDRPRPPASEPAAPAEYTSGFSFGGGGDFNFTKLLDDGPYESPADG